MRNNRAFWPKYLLHLRPVCDNVLAYTMRRLNFGSINHPQVWVERQADRSHAPDSRRGQTVVGQSGSICCFLQQGFNV